MDVRVTARLLSYDLRSVTGRNLSNIAKECGLQRWVEGALNPSTIKRNMRYFETPDEEKWRLDVLQELMSTEECLGGFSSSEIDEMKTWLCTT